MAHEKGVTAPPSKSSIRMVFPNLKALSAIVTLKSFEVGVSESWEHVKGMFDEAETGVLASGGTAPGAALDVILGMPRLRRI